MLFSVGLLTWALQEYRPHFQTQVFEFTRFKLEVLSGILVSFLALYLAFKKLIPGETISSPLRLSSQVITVAFLCALIISFFLISPESSSEGARAFCDIEILIYGGGWLFGLVFMSRKGLLKTGEWENYLYGFSAGMVPAIIMQVACMYDPWHALIFHFGPVLILTFSGPFLISRFIAFRNQKYKRFLNS